MRKFYERPYHNSPPVQAVMDQFPSWMVMRQDEESNGWQFMNAAVGESLDDIWRGMLTMRTNQFQEIGNADLRSLDLIGRLELGEQTTEGIELVQHPDASGFVNGEWHHIYTVDNIQQMEQFQPTRIIYDSEVDLQPIASGDIQGIAYARDYYITTQNNNAAKIDQRHSVWILNVWRNGQTITSVYDPATGSIVAEGYQGQTEISYNSLGYDEVVYLKPTEEDGFAYEFETVMTPEPSSVQIIDILNLDANGNGVLVPQDEFEVDYLTRKVRLKKYDVRPSYNPGEMSGTIFIFPSGDFQPDEGWNSQYIVEYGAWSYTDAHQITTANSNVFGVPVWELNPQMIEVKPSGVIDESVPFTFTRDPQDTSGYDRMLSLSPIHMRPGRTAHVEWDMFDTYEQTINLGDSFTVPDDYEFFKQGIKVFDQAGKNITTDMMTADGNGNAHLEGSGHFITTTPASGLFQSDEYLPDYQWPLGTTVDGFAAYAPDQIDESKPLFDASLSISDRALKWPTDFLAEYMTYNLQEIYPDQVTIKVPYKRTIQMDIVGQSSTNVAKADYRTIIRRRLNENETMEEYVTIIPNTILGINGSTQAESDALQESAMEHFRVTVDRSRTGITWNSDKNVLAFLDANNFSIMEFDGVEGRVFNLFRQDISYGTPLRPDTGEQVTDNEGIVQTFPYEEQDTPSGEVVGLVYYNDFYYFLVDKILYRVNAFMREPDVTAEWTSFDISANLNMPTDITVDEHGDILISDGSIVKRFKFRRDCGLIEQTARILFTRELYDQIDSPDVGASNLVPEQFQVWNQFDEAGLVFGSSRLVGEDNFDYRTRILDVFQNLANSSKQGLINGLSRDLGLRRYDIDVDGDQRFPRV